MTKEIKDTTPEAQPTETQPLTRRKPSFRMTGPVIGLAIAALLIGVIGGFFGGLTVGKLANPGIRTQRMNGPGQDQMGPGMMNGTFGEVTAISQTSITVKDTRSGDSKTYSLTSSTTVTDNGSSASIGDIKQGAMVMVQASSSSENEAASVRLSPNMGGPRGDTRSSNTNTSDTAANQT